MDYFVVCSFRLNSIGVPGRKPTQLLAQRQGRHALKLITWIAISETLRTVAHDFTLRIDRLFAAWPADIGGLPKGGSVRTPSLSERLPQELDVVLVNA